MAKALLYLRQSVADSDDTLSLDSQSSVLAQWAAQQEWHIVGEVRDWNEKGYDDTRPGLAEAMRRAATREYDILAVWSLDRLARSVRILENTLHELAPHGVEVRSYKEAWVSQPMLRQIIGAVAEQQTRDISAHVRRALNQRAQCGLPHGRAPYGYVRDDAGRFAIVEDQATIIHDIFTRFASGASCLAIARDLTGRGIPNPNGIPYWGNVTVRAILARVTYRGIVAQVADAHPAIIDERLWNDVRARRQAGFYPRHGGPESWLIGNLMHACGSRMSLKRPGPTNPSPSFQCYAPYRNQPRTHTYDLTACTIRPANVTRQRAEASVWDLLLAVFAEIAPAAEVIRELTRQATAGAPAAAKDRARLRQRADKTRERLRRAEEMYLNGEHDRAWFDAEKRKAASDEADIAASVGALPEPPDPAAIRQRHAQLRALARLLPSLEDADKGPLLATIGVAVMGAGPPRNPAFWLAIKPEFQALLGARTFP